MAGRDTQGPDSLGTGATCPRQNHNGVPRETIGKQLDRLGLMAIRYPTTHQPLAWDVAKIAQGGNTVVGHGPSLALALADFLSQTDG